MENLLEKALQITIIVWFFIVNLLIIVPAFNLLFIANDEIEKTIPIYPTPPILADVPTIEGQDSKARDAAIVTANQIFLQKTKSYELEVSAYKATLEFRKFNFKQQNYTLVVKDSLVALVTGVLASIVGYAFVNRTSAVVDNLNRMRMGHQPANLTPLPGANSGDERAKRRATGRERTE